ncbi:transposase [Caballeronia calidae]|uniref:Transposase n=1 Tax=Caballeronia calidae TaxID=1777139 RepID=A0A158AB96_9BURK|nr:transposase [Caballeronia calidae]
MSWAATTGGHSGDVVRDVMLAAVENRFGDVLKAPSEIEWLTDNGSGCTAEKTRTFGLTNGPACSSGAAASALPRAGSMKSVLAGSLPALLALAAWPAAVK